MDTQEFERELGAALKATRVQRGVSQARLAEHLGLSRTSVANIEAGGQGLSLVQFLRIAEHLDIAVAPFLESLSLSLDAEPAGSALPAVGALVQGWVDDVAGRRRATPRRVRVSG